MVSERELKCVCEREGERFLYRLNKRSAIGPANTPPAIPAITVANPKLPAWSLSILSGFNNYIYKDLVTTLHPHHHATPTTQHSQHNLICGGRTYLR